MAYDQREDAWNYLQFQAMRNDVPFGGQFYNLQFSGICLFLTLCGICDITSQRPAFLIGSLSGEAGSGMDCQD